MSIELFTVLAQVETSSVKWTDVVDVGYKVFQVVVVVAAALWGYSKFVRAREMRAACAPVLEATRVDVDGKPTLVVNVTLTNCGTMRLSFPSNCRQTITVRAADRRFWRYAESKRYIPWGVAEKFSCDVLTFDGIRDLSMKLEPGESLRRSFPIVLPHDRFVGFRISADIEAQPSWRRKTARRWYADTILVAGGDAT